MNIRWGWVITAAIVLLLAAFIFQTCADYNQRKVTYQQSLGTWENAYENGTLVKETFKKEVEGNHVLTISHQLYDITGDGVPDFEITMKWGKPDTWKYLDESGKPYG